MEAKQAGYTPKHCEQEAGFTRSELLSAGWAQKNWNRWYPLPGSNPRPPPPSLHTSADSCAPPRGLLRTGEHKPIHATAAHDDGWANEQHESYQPLARPTPQPHPRLSPTRGSAPARRGRGWWRCYSSAQPTVRPSRGVCMYWLGLVLRVNGCEHRLLAGRGTEGKGLASWGTHDCAATTSVRRRSAWGCCRCTTIERGVCGWCMGKPRCSFLVVCSGLLSFCGACAWAVGRLRRAGGDSVQIFHLGRVLVGWERSPRVDR